MNGISDPEVLVLGATGTVGGGVVAALLEAGSPVLAVARDRARLGELAQRHAHAAGLETLAGSVADDREAARLAAAVQRRPRPLGAVVACLAGPRECGRLLARPVEFLRRRLDQDLLPHLAAARHLLPLLGAPHGGRYLLIGGPGDYAWSGYGHGSIASAALRMLVRVLHEEARPQGVRVQLLTVDTPVRASPEQRNACSEWPTAQAVGRHAVALLAQAEAASAPVVAYAAAEGQAPASPSLTAALTRIFADASAGAAAAPAVPRPLLPQSGARDDGPGARFGRMR